MNQTVVHNSNSILLLREGGVVEDRGGRKNNVYTYFFVNDRIMHSPTTSPYGYSSFPKEENRVTIAYNYSLELLFHIEAGTGFHVFIG